MGGRLRRAEDRLRFWNDPVNKLKDGNTNIMLDGEHDSEILAASYAHTGIGYGVMGYGASV
jgi:hypothetical protein